MSTTAPQHTPLPALAPATDPALDAAADGVPDGAADSATRPSNNGEPGLNAAGADAADVIGKVASPPRLEASSESFHFWAARGVLVEKTQIVRTDSAAGGTPVRFFGVVEEVYRQSRQADMGEEFDRHDGDVSYTPPYDSAGFCYAKVAILRTEPPVLAPPVEGSAVVVGGEEEARAAYGADEIAAGDALAVGLVKNGGSRFAGPGHIDLGYLLGANGGHLNITGVAGRGAKSSFLLHVNYLLLRKARREALHRPSDVRRLRVVPIVLNVKGFDLFHIDRPNCHFRPERHAADWRQLGVDDPTPFTGARFYAPQLPGQTVPRDTGRPQADVWPYSWALSDVVERGLLTYLFAEEDVRDANFGALVLDLEHWLTEEYQDHQQRRRRRLRQDPSHPRPRTFGELVDHVRAWSANPQQSPLFGHHASTRAKFYRRVFKVVGEGDGVLRRDDLHGNPLSLIAGDTTDPSVVDLSSLASVSSLQRFVVATLLRQLIDDRTGSAAQPGLVYLVTLDELNRFAPRGGHDPITRLVEHVAAEMRSHGIILLGAQQQASLVSPRVIENAGLRALGKTGPVELAEQVWRLLSEAARRKASNLLQTEKLLIQDSFREPMLVHIPFPPWAMRGEDAADEQRPGPSPSMDDAALDNP
ncbi:MAG TPA: hypothetical protein VFB66_08995 [Tepidisphaeraceae bacterium]|nr:hypothetical protein [Tepidisphaeraceae bacterium]